MPEVFGHQESLRATVRFEGQVPLPQASAWIQKNDGMVVILQVLSNVHDFQVLG